MSEHEPMPKSFTVEEDASMTMQRVQAHDRLAHQSRVVLRLGQMLLSSGASAFRVKYSMAQLARAVGIQEHRAQVTYSEILTTAYANGTFRTELAENRVLGINADRIDRLVNYVESLRGTRAVVEDVDAALDEIDTVKPLYGWLPNALASGLACAAFAFLNGGGPIECSVVAIAAFVGQFLRRQLLHRRMNHFGVWMLCGLSAALVYIGGLQLLDLIFHVAATHHSGIISAILFLVPGFPLVTGIIDLVRHDFQSGIARLTYVSMLLVSAGVAVWALSLAFEWPLRQEYVVPVEGPVLYILRFITSYIAAFGFAMLFNSPPKVCAAAAGIGAVVNTARLLLRDEITIPNQAAVGVAALVAGLLAIWVAQRTRFSRVTLSVPAVVIMIPGVPLYRALAFLSSGNTTEALAALFEVFFVVSAIGVGLSISRMLTDREWLMETPKGVPRLEALPMRY